MTEKTTIPKEETSTLDYDVLRKKALEHIEQLAGKTWTDYNTHDPGITLLETLVYALTDLSYRTNLSIEDLLASNPVEGFDPSLFQAESILPAHPLTLEDTKKQLLDTDGVQNVWVHKLTEGKQKIYFDESDNSLQNSIPETGAEVPLSGLYGVEVELESDQAVNSDEVLSNVKNGLRRDRNLCEDLVQVNPIQTKNVKICATIIFSLEADVESSLANMFFRIHQFFNPRIYFDSLETLQKEGIPVEELFEGPLLHKGFLRKDSLEKIRKENSLYFSDVLAAMWASGEEQGILSIHEHPDHPFLVNFTEDPQSNVGYLSIDEHIQPILDIDNSEIHVFFETKKGQSAEIYAVAMDEVSAQFDELKQDNINQADLVRTRLESPQGTQKTITEYLSVQEELPSVYAVGNNVPPKSGTSPERLAQSKQLQGFLLLFDQLMGNYLTQLSQVGSLFSYAPQDHTYFSQVLKEVTGIRDLLDGYDGTTEGDWNEFITTTFSDTLQQITEPTNIGFIQRRHQFLDHLLARFSERYTDTSNLQDTGQVLVREGITAKEYLLNSYDQLSKQRGKGFNYWEENLWGPSSKVSGYEQWIRAKLGITDMTRDSLCSSESLFDSLLFGQNQNFTDSISIGPNPYTNLTSWTLELWLLPEQPESSATLIEIQDEASQNLLHVAINDQAELLFTIVNEVPTSVLSEGLLWNEWMQLAVSYDQSTATTCIFINGNQIQEITFSGTLPTFADSTAVLGNNVDRDAVLKGAIAKFLLWNKPLSESELIAHTRDTSVEMHQNLLGYWKVESNEGTVTFNDQKALSSNHGVLQGNPDYQERATTGNGTFHMVEHLLLRPKDANSSHFLTPPSQFDNDPYSNQLSVICPEWIAPFSGQGHRNHFTHLLQTETPAHLYLNILWISNPSHLWQFELHYREWLQAQSAYLTLDNEINGVNYKTAHKNFIDTFKYLSEMDHSTN